MKRFPSLLLTLLLLLACVGCQSEQELTAEKDTSVSPEEGISQQAEDSTMDAYQTLPTPEGKPKPVEPQDVTPGDQTFTCTISISCATILDNMENLEKGKDVLVPADGWIMEPTEVPFTEGESVFDVLLRVTKERKLHMEFSNPPMYNSAYVEGIGNLYEYDCGNLSGWMFNVNGWYPNYGCSRYQLKDGDVVNWVYTCDLGADVGDNSMTE